jgi:hypothetical protein
MPNPNQFKSHEEYLQYYRDYRDKNRDKFRRYSKKYNKEWRKKYGYHNEKKWKKENPEKCKAQRLLRYAVKIKIIDKKPCEVCGKKNKIVGHHPDYSKPLVVIWLCRIHHAEIHKKI